jgi:hypothetical protein
MELSPEHKERILEEEKQRIAEEAYRAKVRQQLADEALASKPTLSERTTSPQSERKRSILPLALLFLGIAIVVLGVVFLFPKTNIPTPAATSETPTARTPNQTKGQPTVSEKFTTAQIAAKATPAVVIIENFNEDGAKTSQGSGYVFSPDGIVVSNYHVIRGAGSLSITVPSMGKVRVENVLGYSPETDVAILQLPQATTASLETEATQTAKVGDHVVAIGAPLGLESTVSEGIISALRDGAGIHIIQTTASISPGSSGGPLLDDYGKVIGLTTAKIRNGENLNFVVSATHINDLVNRKHPVPLAEMLSETLMTDHIASNTISVPARNSVSLRFMVRSEQGALLDGSYSVSGGTGNDVAVALVTSDNRVILNSGVVKGGGQLHRRLARGSYAIVFDNRFSTFTSKSVSPTFTLSYYR